MFLKLKLTSNHLKSIVLVLKFVFGFFYAIRTATSMFVCTTSLMNISNSPESLLLQDFHLYLEDQEDHGHLADQEHQEYQKVPTNSRQG